MKITFLFFFVLFSFTSFSQEETVDTTRIDSEYNDEEQYYDEYSDYDEYSSDTVYYGYVFFLGFETKNSVISKPDKFFSNPAGFGIGLYKQLKKDIPFFIGMDFSFDFYGQRSYDYIDIGFEDGYEYQFSDSFTGDLISIDFGGKYFSRKSFWRLNPYVHFNLEYRYAYATINTKNIDLGETINTDFEGGNSSLGYDIGVGSLIDINSDNLFLYLSIDYNSGGGLFLYKYMPGDHDVFDVRDYFDYKYFPFGFLTIKLGIAFSK